MEDTEINTDSVNNTEITIIKKEPVFLSCENHYEECDANKKISVNETNGNGTNTNDQFTVQEVYSNDNYTNTPLIDVIKKEYVNSDIYSTPTSQMFIKEEVAEFDDNTLALLSIKQEELIIKPEILFTPNTQDENDHDTHKSLFVYPEYDTEEKTPYNDEKPYMCSLCDYDTYKIYRIKRHMMTHNVKVKRPSHGKYFLRCMNTDRDKIKVKQPPPKKRTRATFWQCPLCDYETYQKCPFRYHLRTHNGKEPFSCTYCDFKYANDEQLNRHLKKHTGEKPFYCTRCDFRCAQKSIFIRHRKTHTGSKPFSCTMCDFCCSQKVYLIEHFGTHTGDKPFACTVCDFKCGEELRFKRHLGIHPKRKNLTFGKLYKCPICDFIGFKSGLSDHFSRHIDRENLVCEVCGHICSSRKSLRRHLLIHIDSDISKVEIEVEKQADDIKENSSKMEVEKQQVNDDKPTLKLELEKSEVNESVKDILFMPSNFEDEKVAPIETDENLLTLTTNVG